MSSETLIDLTQKKSWQLDKASEIAIQLRVENDAHFRDLLGRFIHEQVVSATNTHFLALVFLNFLQNN